MYVCANLYIYIWIRLCIAYFWNEYNCVPCLLICVLTLTEGLLTRRSMIPNSASWEATLSLLIKPTQGWCIPNLGAIFLYAWLGICQNISSGTLSGNTKLVKNMKETDLFNKLKKNKIKNNKEYSPYLIGALQSRKPKPQHCQSQLFAFMELTFLSFSLSV